MLACAVLHRGVHCIVAKNHLFVSLSAAVRTSTSASSVRVLPVPGGPCHSVKVRVMAFAMALQHAPHVHM
jgi:hypothetical protein